MLITAILAAGIALPAATQQPAPTSITADKVFDGKKTEHLVGAYEKNTEYIKVNAKGSDFKQVQVQQKVNGKWVKKYQVGDGKASDYTQYVDLNPAGKKKVKGLTAAQGTKGTYRLYLPATKTSKASATPEKVINWSKPLAQHGVSLPFGSGKTVSVNTTSNHIYRNLSMPATAKLAYVEKKSGAKWVNAATLSNWTGKKTSAKFWVYLPKAGSTDTYRVRIAQTETHKEYVSGTQALTVPKRNSKLTTWNNKPKFPVSTGRSATATGWVTGGKRQAELQRWNGKKWVASTKASTLSDGQYTLKTPKGTSQTKISYRVHIPATSSYKAVTGPSFQVSFENPNKYTGYKKTIYNHIKKYCPNITINVVKPNKNYDGLAHMSYDSITVVSGKSGNRLKHIALHECGHMLQDWASNYDYKKISDRLNKIYKTKGSRGIENNADCIARQIGSPGPYSYNSNCSGARGTAAKNIVKGKMP